MDDLGLLIKKAQEGDKEAFGEIYKLFYRRIYRYCQINLERVEIAQDLCQETFIKAWRSLPKFKLSKGGSFQAYLFKIARNLIIDLSRKKKEISLEKIAEIEINEDLEKNLDLELIQKKVNQALTKLEDLEKQIVILRFFEDMSNFEIAKILDINEGALRVKLHRVLKKLRQIMEN